MSSTSLSILLLVLPALVSGAAVVKPRDYWGGGYNYGNSDAYYLAQAQSSVSGLAPGWSAAGCYSDFGWTSTLNKASGSSWLMNYGTCTDFCSSQGYAYAGVEAGWNCYCGDSIDRSASIVDYGNCGTTCPGNWWQDCGGSNYINIFHLATAPAPAPPAASSSAPAKSSMSAAVSKSSSSASASKSASSSAAASSSSSSASKSASSSSSAATSSSVAPKSSSASASSSSSSSAAAKSSSAPVSSSSASASSSSAAASSASSSASKSSSASASSASASSASSAPKSSSAALISSSSSAPAVSSSASVSSSSAAASSSAAPVSVSSAPAASASSASSSAAASSASTASASSAAPSSASASASSSSAAASSAAPSSNLVPSIAVSVPAVLPSLSAASSAASLSAASSSAAAASSSAPAPSAAPSDVGLPSITISLPVVVPSSSAAASSTSSAAISLPTIPVLPSGWNTGLCIEEGHDNGGRALAKAHYASSDMTQATCAAFCSSKGYTIAGLEYSTECWCGDALSSGASLLKQSASCNMPCGGASNTICGGSGVLTLVVSDIAYSVLNAELTGKIVTLPLGWSAASSPCIAEGTSGRALAAASTASDDMTIDKCISFCDASGWQYAGIEYGRECYCANAITGGASLTLTSNTCNMPCAGDDALTCGGSNGLQLYQNPGNALDLSIINGFALQGCIQEVAGRALSSKSFTDPQMTVEKCTSFCSSNGFAFAGIEYGSECYCGNGYSNGASLGLFSNQCTMSCPGNNKETCGGPNALTVYVSPAGLL